MTGTDHLLVGTLPDPAHHKIGEVWRFTIDEPAPFTVEFIRLPAGWMCGQLPLLIPSGGGFIDLDPRTVPVA